MQLLPKFFESKVFGDKIKEDADNGESFFVGNLGTFHLSTNQWMR